MTPPQPDQELMARYLLGELPGAERIEFEHACLDDDQAFEELTAVEAELMDDYVRGVLKGRRRERFERRILSSPTRRDELELARLIMQTAALEAAPRSARPTPGRGQHPLWQAFLASLGSHRQARQFSFATALVVLVGIGAWMFWSSSRKPLPPGQTASARPPLDTTPRPALSPPVNQEKQNSSTVATPSPEDQGRSVNSSAHTPPPLSGKNPRPARIPQNRERGLREPSPQPTPLTAPPRRTLIPTFALVSGFERSAGGVNEINILPGIDRVRLRIDLAANQYQAFSAGLKRVEGQQILVRNDLRAVPAGAGQTLTLELPTSALPTGDYILTLSGSVPRGKEIFANYFLRVKKQ